MRRRRTVRRAIAMLACTSVIPLLALACKKPEPVVVDAGPPPVATDAAPAVLAPLDEDAAVPDAADAAPVKHATGTGLTTNQARAKQCCAAIRSQAKALAPNSPEGNVMLNFATGCDAFALQVGPTAGGQAPELAPLRAFLKGKTVPPVCQGL